LAVDDLQIRLAEPKDAEIVALLARITFGETFGYLFERHKDDLRAYLDRTFGVEKIRRSLVHPVNRYWLGLLAGLPVSFAKLKFPSPIPLAQTGNVAQLQKIYVLHEFVGEGVGKPLIDAVLADAVLRQADTVWLDVLKENARAVRFYERRGFRMIGEDRYAIGAQTFAFHLMALGGTGLRTDG
jgi:ribosomal protein S18 acetylase RimI-like enzyme